MDLRTERMAREGPAADISETQIPAEGLQLHLGSGPYAEPGWINVDKSRTPPISRIRPLVRVLARAGVLTEQQRNTIWPREVIRRDLSKPLPWGDNSARAIYSAHMVEHFERAEAQRLLGECLRVLAPGGVLRLALPDVQDGVSVYLQQKEAGNPRAADELVGSLFYMSHGDMPRIRRLATGLLHRPHQWMYDIDSMRALLSEVGYGPIHECAFRRGACPDLATIEIRDGVDEPASFYIEAFKP
ncbi:MAG: methyltransferase domain-containing protein [Chloroflexi bacterium]|nr:methyltransferase domain-containing protein [Chloroflexota bacterium]